MQPNRIYLSTNFTLRDAIDRLFFSLQSANRYTTCNNHGAGRAFRRGNNYGSRQWRNWPPRGWAGRDWRRGRTGSPTRIPRSPPKRRTPARRLPRMTRTRKRNRKPPLERNRPWPMRRLRPNTVRRPDFGMCSSRLARRKARAWRNGWEYVRPCDFRCLQEGNAVQGNIPAFTDQQFSQQAAGDVLPSLLESTETEVPDYVEHRGSQSEGQRQKEATKNKSTIDSIPIRMI